MAVKNMISEMTDQELLKKLKDDRASFNKMQLFHKASSLDSPIVEIGVFNSCVMLLMKSVLTSLNLFC